MGFFDSISDMLSAATPWSEHQAEAVAGGSSDKRTPANAEVHKEEGEVKDPEAATPDKREVSNVETVSGKEASGNDGDEKEEEEEEEEEELVDPKDKLEAECKESKQCSSTKHHYDECVDRVTSAINEDRKPGEDCVEEFFHLAHCATQCAAPKLWAQLK